MLKYSDREVMRYINHSIVKEASNEDILVSIKNLYDVIFPEFGLLVSNPSYANGLSEIDMPIYIVRSDRKTFIRTIGHELAHHVQDLCGYRNDDIFSSLNNLIEFERQAERIAYHLCKANFPWAKLHHSVFRHYISKKTLRYLEDEFIGY